MLVQPDGTVKWESVHYAPNRDGDGNVVGIYAVHTDVHEQKRNEDALRRANWMLSSHIGNTPLAVMEWDRDFKLVRWSPQAENIFGWNERRDPRHAARPTTCSLHEKRPRARRPALVERLIGGEEPRATGLTRNYRKDGADDLVRVVPLRAAGRAAAQIVSILSFVQDVSSRVQAEERLQYLATRDALTGLPNRLLLHERLTQAIAQAKRTGRRVGVLFIDLDRFKNVNDTLGHRIGDELLKAVTAALAGALRETDLLARLGGDEFMVIVEEFDDPSVLGRIAQKLCDAIAHPIQDRGARHLRDVVDRHRRVSRRFRRSGRAAEARRRCDVPQQGARPQHLPVPRREPRRASAQAALAGDGAARGAQGEPARAALPAAGAHPRQPHHRRRGAAALDRSRARQRAAERVHSARRGVRAHPRARRVGAAATRPRSAVRGATRACSSTVAVNLSARQFYREDLAAAHPGYRAGRQAASRRGSSSK